MPAAESTLTPCSLRERLTVGQVRLATAAWRAAALNMIVRPMNLYTLGASSALLVLSSATTMAQRSDRARAVADSAQVARAAFQRAVDASRRHDTQEATREIVRAAEAWPTQQVYVYNAAALSARSGDTSSAMRWLDRYATLGFGRDPGEDSSFASVAAAPGFERIAARIRGNAQPLARSTVAFTLADSTFHPEGIAYDSRTKRWFLGSIRHRLIVSVDSAGRSHPFAASGPGVPLGSVLGMSVDSVRRVLWVATSNFPRMDGFAAADSGRAGIIAFDLDHGRLVRQAWLAGGATTHGLGDVTVAPDGTVYTSDSQAPALYVLRPGSAKLALVTDHPALHSPQGMAIAADGQSLYLADYSHGILRIDLATGRVSPVSPAPGLTTLGSDGLYLQGRSLIAVQNGVTPTRVTRFCLDAAGDRITAAEVLDRNLTVADEPTLGVLVGTGAFYYVATSSWDKYDDDGKRVDGTTLRAPTVLRLPLARATCAP